MEMLYRCSECGLLFNSYIECCEHEQRDKSIIDNRKILKKSQNTIVEKSLKESIKTTNDFVYKILLPNLTAIAETTGSTTITFCLNNLQNNFDSRISKQFVFDENAFSNIMRELDFNYSILKNKGFRSDAVYTVTI